MADKEQFKNLSEIKKNWGKAVESRGESNYFEPEDGRYNVQIDSAEYGEAKSSGRPQVGWRYVFLEGEYRGKSLLSFDGINTEIGLRILLNKIELLGFEVPESFEDMEPTLKKITKKKPYVRIAVKTTKADNGNEYRNVRIERLVDEGDLEDLGAPPAADEPEPEPESEKPNKLVSREKPEASAKEDDSLEIDKGSTVLAMDGDKELGIGEVQEIDEEAQEVVVKINGKKHIVPFDELRKPPTEKPKTKVKVGK